MGGSVVWRIADPLGASAPAPGSRSVVITRSSPMRDSLRRVASARVCCRAENSSVVGISTIACFDQHDVQAFLEHRIVEEDSAALQRPRMSCLKCIGLHRSLTPDWIEPHRLDHWGKMN